MAHVIVDAENVRRSQWPNLSRADLVARARAWADREGHSLLVVFDGDPPADAPDLVGTRYADDEIVRRASVAPPPWWLASSDRELIRRVEPYAPSRVVGGGGFLRELDR